MDLILTECIFNGYKQLELIPDVQLFIFMNSGPNNLKSFSLPVMCSPSSADCFTHNIHIYLSSLLQMFLGKNFLQLLFCPKLYHRCKHGGYA